MSRDLFMIWRDWIGLGVSQAIVGPATMMWIKGTMPPPFSNKKADPVLAAVLFTFGLTLTLVFGSEDLLQRTIGLFVK